MSKKSLVAFLLSFLILFGIFASSAKVMAVTIKPPTLLNIDGKPTTFGTLKTTNRTPTLVGRCNLPFAIMEYGMRNSPDLGLGYADGRGIWRWTVPQELGYGVHVLYVTATDPNDASNSETSAFQIEISKNSVSLIELGLPWFLAVAILYIGTSIILKRLDLRPRKD